MSADDDWANWKPEQDAKAQAGSAFKARVALSSHGGSVSPDRRRPSVPASPPPRNAFNNNRNSNNGRDAISRNLGPSPAKPADVVAVRNFSRGEQPRSPFNMRNGAANNARDVPPSSSSNSRAPPSDANPDRRAARPRSPELDRERNSGRRTESARERNRDDERKGKTPPNSAREAEREDRSSRTSKRDERLRERSRSRDRANRSDTREKDKAKEQDRDGDSRRSKDDNNRRDRDRTRDGDRRDSGRSYTRRRDDSYRNADRRSDRETERKPREDPSPRDRPSRRDDDREDRRSSLKRARTPDASDSAVKPEVSRQDGGDFRRRDRREDERNDRSEKPRDRRQDRRDITSEENTRHSKRVKEETPPPKSAKSDLSQASLQDPIVPEDVEMRSNTPPPRSAEKIPEPVEPEVSPQVGDGPLVEEVEMPTMDEPYLAEGHTQHSLQKKPKILIRNLAPGTSHSDIQYFCDDFGVVLAVSSTADPENVESRIFEVAFNAMREAESAVASIDNMQADGQILKANVVRGGGLRIKGADQTNKGPSTVNTPTTAVPGQSPSAASLLSRLSNPAPLATTPTTSNAKKAKAPANGSLPNDLLSPYTELLEKAGVRSLPALKKVLRPDSIPAYVEMLAERFPNEELLSGLTAKWALRERLEELLGQKKEGRIDWGERVKS